MYQLKNSYDSNITILSIDDNLNNLDTLSALIKENFTYDVISTQSAKEAMNILSKNKINLIICDIQMPEIDGFSFAKLVKMNKKHQEIPIIFLTAHSNIELYSSSNAYMVGAADYLTKPINEIELMNKLKGYLKPLEAELQVSTMRKMLLESSVVGTMIVDKDKNILYTNQMASGLLEFYKSYDTKHDIINSLFLNSGNMEPFELQCNSQTILCFHTLLADGTLKVEFQDITTLKEQESILLLRNRFAAMGEMISNIAHQWRQPLQEISLLLMQADIDMIENVEFDRQKTKRLNYEISKTVKYLSLMINDFRNFFDPKKAKQIFDIHRSVTATIKFMEDVLKTKNITVLNEESYLPAYVDGYKNELQQVLMNILGNSSDAYLQHPCDEQVIKIRYVVDDTTVSIIIDDNAGGIASDIIHKVFDPYFTTKHQSRGTGLGLYMSKTIIEVHFKGKLIAENIEKGARVTNILSLVDPSKAQHELSLYDA